MYDAPQKRLQMTRLHPYSVFRNGLRVDEFPDRSRQLGQSLDQRIDVSLFCVCTPDGDTDAMIRANGSRREHQGMVGVREGDQPSVQGVLVLENVPSLTGTGVVERDHADDDE